jgi:hypothetical protein
MSDNLFINAGEAAQRMESIIRAKCKKCNLVLCEDMNEEVKNDALKIVYNAQITYTSRDGKQGYFSVSGNGFPDLFDKVANELTTHKPL